MPARNLRTRFALVIAASIAILLTGTVATMVGIVHIRGTILENRRYQGLVNDLFVLRGLSQEYAVSHSPRAEEQWRRQYDRIVLGIGKTPQLPLEVAEAFTNIRSIFGRVSKLPPPAENAPDAGGRIRERLQKQLLSSLLTETQRIIDWARDLSDDSANRLTQLVQGYSAGAVTLLTLIASLTSWILVTTEKHILRSLTVLKEGASVISKGDLDHRIELSGPDEFGQLANAFNAMTDNLRLLYREMDRTNRALLTISGCDQILVRAQDESELLRDICQLIVVGGNYRFCWIGFADQGESLRPVASAGFEEGYLQPRGPGEASPAALGPPAEAVRSGGLVLVPDLAAAAESAPWRTAAMERGFVALVALPLRIGGRVIGSLNIYADRKEIFTHGEVSLLEDLANDISFGLQTHREKARRQAAEERLSRLAAAVEQAAEAIVITDPGAIITYVNPTFERITGYSATEAAGRAHDFLRRGRIGESSRELWESVRNGATWKGRYIVQAKDGSEVILDGSVATISAPDGGTVGYVSTWHDVTSHVEMEAHLAQAQKLEAIGTLAGGIAHDFNNILSGILGYAELSLMSLQPDSEVGQYVTAICQASNRAANLVKQILTFSRMGNQEEQEIQVTPIVREAMKLMRASIPTTVDIRMNVLANPVVLADPTEIHRILVNLCTNASLAMRDREGTLEVRLDEVDLDADFAAAHPEISPGRFMRLTVRDTGCGMSPEVASRIFDPFFTTRGEGEGTGMGLSVVHGIVRKRHGLILVESEPDRGTSFEVLLPMVEEGEEGRIDLLGAPLTGTGRILFVDDEPLVADTAERMLRALGYTVSAFTASLEALAEFRRKPDAFDLVITDVTMPGLTGDALAARIREIRPGIPVVLCTGHTDRITAEKAKELGFDGFLLKPVVLGDLSRTVYRLLVRW